jgi:hypothetical protein
VRAGDQERGERTPLQTAIISRTDADDGLVNIGMLNEPHVDCAPSAPTGARKPTQQESQNQASRSATAVKKHANAVSAPNVQTRSSRSHSSQHSKSLTAKDAKNAKKIDRQSG